MEILRAENICKSYENGDNRQQVLKNLNVTFKKGTFNCIMGASGSGKSSLLYVLSGLDTSDGGSVFYKNNALPKSNIKNDKALSQIRSNHFGFIFQFYNLMPSLSIRENIQLPLLLAGKKVSDYSDKISTLVQWVGLEDKLDKKVSRLSGGEQQRVSIVRALSTDADIIFADEPTGNLDYDNSMLIIELLRKMSSEMNKTVIMVTHDVDVASMSDRILVLKNGEIAKEEENVKNYRIN